MELVLLSLLLPVAAASGWWIARRSMEKERPAQRMGLSADYFTGLNYLLNEQPDKAVDVFIKMLEVDSETVETHLALGNLFRRRGEGDRAIRIHQNLIARPTLTKEQRAQALLELGKDYMRAGVLDRAENLFLELADDKQHKVIALESLLDIYQQEKDWEKAISTARNIEASTGNKMSVVVAQYSCELGDNAAAKGEYKLATKMYKRALSSDKSCVRANLSLGSLERKNGNCKSAIKAYKQVEQQDPHYLVEVIEPMFDCYQSLGKIDEMEAYLKHLERDFGGIGSTLALTELIRLREGEDAAIKTIVASLRQKPTVAGLHRLIELKLMNSEGAERDNLLVLKDLTSRLLENHHMYQCNNCGFTGKTLHWHCPTCRKWCTIKPMPADDAE